MTKTSPTTTANRGVRNVEAVHIAKPNQPGQLEQCQVVEEDTLAINIEQVGSYTLMWTPTETIKGGAGFTHADGVLADHEYPAPLCLAVGFAFTEGIIDSLDDIATMAICPDEDNVVNIQLHHPETVKARRSNVIITSSCGICGKRDILENNVLGLSTVPDSMQLGRTGFAKLMQLMKERQAIFQDTGGCHAAGIFSADGQLHTVAEDLGRHNAFDKVIGRTLLEHGDFAQRGALLSSRLSFEMVVKAIRANLEIIAAVSAPTSLAIDIADQFGLTLCGFVRGERATIYTHPHRI
ncbi:MAG: formate dehydrogenase accessory sulfurtransferase FdhD [Pseudomonadales bacterium]